MRKGRNLKKRIESLFWGAFLRPLNPLCRISRRGLKAYVANLVADQLLSRNLKKRIESRLAQSGDLPLVLLRISRRGLKVITVRLILPIVSSSSNLKKRIESTYLGPHVLCNRTRPRISRRGLKALWAWVAVVQQLSSTNLKKRIESRPQRQQAGLQAFGPESQEED